MPNASVFSIPLRSQQAQPPTKHCLLITTTTTVALRTLTNHVTSFNVQSLITASLVKYCGKAIDTSQNVDNTVKQQLDVSNVQMYRSVQ